MKILKDNDRIIIRYIAREQIEAAVFAGLLLWAVTSFFVYLFTRFANPPSVFSDGLNLFYIVSFLCFLFLGTMERKIIIEPGKIHIKDFSFKKEIVMDVDPHKNILSLEVYPVIRWEIFPGEIWEINLIDCNGESRIIARDCANFGSIRNIAHAVSKYLNMYIIDYSYEFHSESILFLSPSFIDMPYGTRVTYFPELILTADKPERPCIVNTEKSSSRREYIWVDMTSNSFLRAVLSAFLFASLVAFEVVGIKNSIINIPFFPSKESVYMIIAAIFLIYIFYLSGVRKKLILDRENLEYIFLFNKYPLKNIKIPRIEVQEVMIKPSMSGFKGLVMGGGKMIPLDTTLGGYDDFENVLWLVYQTQEFLLENRS